MFLSLRETRQVLRLLQEASRKASFQLGLRDMISAYKAIIVESAIISSREFRAVSANKRDAKHQLPGIFHKALTEALQELPPDDRRRRHLPRERSHDDRDLSVLDSNLEKLDKTLFPKTALKTITIYKLHCLLHIDHPVSVGRTFHSDEALVHLLQYAKSHPATAADAAEEREVYEKVLGVLQCEADRRGKTRGGCGQ
jgi:hypothetical protein